MKWILIFLVLVAAGALVWWMGWLNPYIDPYLNSLFPKPVVEAPVQQTPEVRQPSTGLPTSDTDTSDSALMSDTAAIDAELKVLESDSASVDESLNDKPVQQSY